MENKKGVLEQLDAKSALLIGLGGGILVLGTIGFLILGGYILKNGLVDKVSAQKNNSLLAAPLNTYQNQPTDNLAAGTLPPIDNNDHIQGDENAPVAIVEYSDFECPFCQRFHPTMQRVMDDYAGKVRWIYRHFPLTSIHRNAQRLAESSECAGELGGDKAFWQYADQIFATRDYTNDNLTAIAKKIGLNSAKFTTCLTSGKYSQKVSAMTTAGEAAGVDGTPGSFLIGKDGQARLISGAVPFETLKAAIDAELSK